MALRKNVLLFLFALLWMAPVGVAQPVAGPEANPRQRMGCASKGDIRNDDGRCVGLSTYFEGRRLRHVGEGEEYRTIEAANAAVHPSDVVVIHGGVYRESITAPASNVTYVAYPGDNVIINGADLINDRWVLHEGNVYKRPYAGLPVLSYDCPWQDCSGHYWRPELLFVDGTLMEHVEGVERLDQPGEFYVDGGRSSSGGYTSSPTTIFAWFPGSPAPSDHSIEFGVRTRLFEPEGAGQGCHSASHTRLRVIGLEFRNAAPADSQYPAVCSSHEGDVYEEVSIVNSGWVGIKFYGTNHVLRGSTISLAGISGIAGGSDSTLIEYNSVTANGFRSVWAQNVEGRGLIWGKGSAGLKKTNSHSDIIRANVFKGNHGPGIWYDTANSGVLIERNVIGDNAASGLFMETGKRGVNNDDWTHSFTVQNNVVYGTRWGQTTDLDGNTKGERGECIGTSSSGNHIIVFNTIFGCDGEGINIIADSRCPECNGGNYIFNNLIYNNNRRNAPLGYEVRISTNTNSLNGNVYWDKSGLSGKTFRYNATGDITNSLTDWKSILDTHQAHLAGDDSSVVVAAGPGLVEDFTSDVGWRLIPGSAARERAVSLPQSIQVVLEDIDGDPRPRAGGDVGADQYAGSAARGAQLIPLRKGWNYVSLAVQPDAESIDNILGEAMSEVELVKDGGGRVFSPALGIDEIGEWEVQEAYMIYARNETALAVDGQSTGSGFTLSLEEGWNLIPYPRSDAAAVEEVLRPILSDVVMMKDAIGQVFYPEYGINSIGEMRSGKGYLLNVKKAVTLTYY